MAKSVKTGIKGDSSVFNLRPIKLENIRPDASSLLLPDEQIIGAFKTIRDQVIFTDLRVLVVNVQGVGMKIAYISYPYEKVLYFGIETAGVIDIDSEMTLYFADGAVLQFDFTLHTDVREIYRAVSQCIL